MANTKELMETIFYGKDEFYVLKFPLKLWRILNSNDTGAIWWGPFGTTIFIDFQLFRAEYLECSVPKFKTKNMTSFVRQLNMYGFRKLRSLPIRSLNVHEFYNTYFRYGRPDLLFNVKRKTIPLKMNGFKRAYLIEHSQRHFEDVLIRSHMLRAFWEVPQANFEGEQVIAPKYQIQVVPLHNSIINEDSRRMTANIVVEFIRLVVLNPSLDLNESNESDWDDIDHDLNCSGINPLPNDSNEEKTPMLINGSSLNQIHDGEDKEVFIHIPDSNIPEADLYESLTKSFSSI